MKQYLFILLSVILLADSLAPQVIAQQLAFPGASGYAQHITGGRGGKVYYVTSLQDCTDDDLVPGTLRWAMLTGDDTPRTILFAVSGTIYLESKLKSRHPNVSILGQSAPGGGICITGYPVYINSRNYIIRHIRFRAGEIPALEGTGNESYSGLDIENAVGVMLDHCSVTWSMEECLTMFDNDTTTVQHCIIGEGLYHSYNVKTTGESSGRSFAMQWGGEHSNMHHVLITNCNGRGPRFNGVRTANAWAEGKEGKRHAHDCHIDGDFANNVFYNWGGGHLSYYGGEFFASLFADAPADLGAYNRIYMRNNYFRPGPSTQKNGGGYRHFFHPSGDSDKQVGQWYLSGNKFELSSYYAPTTTYWKDASLKTVNDDNLAGFGTASSALDLGIGYKSHLMTSIPYELSPYQPVSADQAYLEVTDEKQGAGASRPRYDEEDLRLINEAGGRRDGVKPFVGSRASNASQRPGIIDSPEDITFEYGTDKVVTKAGNSYTCYPNLGCLPGEKYAVDSDADGMPDGYEEAMGLNPRDAADGATYAANGYTHLENYLNALADFEIAPNDYQTSDTYVEPGLGVRPATFTLTFTAKAEVEGTLPTPLTLAYGSTVTFRSEVGFSRPGYSFVGWNDGSMTYRLDQPYTGYFRSDVTLSAVFEKNEEEEGPVDFTGKTFHSPQVGNCLVGITDYTTIESESERVWTAEKNVADAKNFMSVNAKDYELIYCNLSTIHATDWMETIGQERDAYRNVLNPNGADTVQFSGSETTYTHPLNGFIVGKTKSSTYKLYAYVKDCSRVRTYAAGSGSGGDYMQVIAIPSDNSDRLTSNNIHKLYKSANFSEYFDIDLDPDQAYRLEWSSIGGVDMMVGAIKLYDRTAERETSGDAVVMWDWNNEATVNAVVDPAKAFTSATATIGSALKLQRGENGNDPDGNQLYVVQFKAADAVTAPAADHSVSYRITPRAGYKFTPTQVDFSRRFQNQGTGTKGQVDVYFQYGNAEELYIRKTASTSAVENISIKSSTASFADKFLTTTAPFTVRLYLYNMPAGDWVDLYNIKVSGTWEKSQEIVDGDEDENEDEETGIFHNGPYQAIVSNVKELKSALRAAAKTSDERYRIFLRNGEYDFGTTAKTAVPQNTSLIGESEAGVILFNTPSASVTDYQNQTPVLFIDQNQNDVYLQDLTLRANRDWAAKKSQGQALAMRQRGKRAIYKQVTMQGVQDTYYLNKADASAYFEDCTVAGEVDFIYGDGTMWFEHCSLQPVSSGAYITAPNTQPGYMGIVFHECVIEQEPSVSGSVAGYRLGRPWGDSPAATFLHTTMRVLPADAGWGAMAQGLTLRFHEYGSMDANGTLLDLSKRSLAACKGSATSDAPVLTADEAAAYSVEKVFAKVAVGWDPDALCAQLSAPALHLDAECTTLSWEPVADALCYAICHNGAVIDFTTETSYPLAIADGIYTLRVANQMGGLSQPSGTASALSAIEADAPSTVIYDLFGRAVANPTKGIYVVVGQKCFVR